LIESWETASIINLTTGFIERLAVLLRSWAYSSSLLASCLKYSASSLLLRCSETAISPYASQQSTLQV
jgi:hypothetical protein